jgi:hypothetical protein
MYPILDSKIFLKEPIYKISCAVNSLHHETKGHSSRLKGFVRMRIKDGVSKGYTHPVDLELNRQHEEDVVFLPGRKCMLQYSKTWY